MFLFDVFFCLFFFFFFFKQKTAYEIRLSLVGSEWRRCCSCCSSTRSSTTASSRSRRRGASSRRASRRLRAGRDRPGPGSAALRRLGTPWQRAADRVAELRVHRRLAHDEEVWLAGG